MYYACAAVAVSRVETHWRGNIAIVPVAPLVGVYWPGFTGASPLRATSWPAL